MTRTIVDFGKEDEWSADWNSIRPPRHSTNEYMTYGAMGLYERYGDDYHRNVLAMRLSPRLKGLAIWYMRKKNIPFNRYDEVGQELLNIGLLAALEAVPTAPLTFQSPELEITGIDEEGEPIFKDDLLTVFDKHLLKAASNAMAKQLYYRSGGTRDKKLIERSMFDCEDTPDTSGLTEAELCSVSSMLSPCHREREVIRLAAKGHTRSAIAQQVGLSKYKVRRILLKIKEEN